MDTETEPHVETSIDPTEFRAVMGRFATGVTVVTTLQDEQRVGITVNAFASISLDPPLVLISLDRGSRTNRAVAESGVFAVNILSREQEALARCFAHASDARYADFCYAASHPVATGAPVLDSSLGFVDCRVVASYPGGDHTLYLGQVEALGGDEGSPLLYFRSHYDHLDEGGS